MSGQGSYVAGRLLMNWFSQSAFFARVCISRAFLSGRTTPTLQSFKQLPGAAFTANCFDLIP